MASTSAAAASGKQALLGQVKKIAEYEGLNPFKKYYINPLLRDFYGHVPLRALSHYVNDFEGPFQKEVYETELTSIRCNLMYSNVWLWQHHLMYNREPIFTE